MRSPIEDYLHRVLTDCRDDDGGAVMTGNQQLEKADPDLFGIALATVDGTVYTAGEADHEFSIQSISKAFTYALALRDGGLDRVRKRVDAEPSGEKFNEISLERDTGRPRNAFINAGALAVHDLVEGDDAHHRSRRIVDEMSRLAGRELEVDQQVYEAELAADDHNKALAYLLRSAGQLDSSPDEVVDGYARQCAIRVDSKDLAIMGAVMANGGVSTSSDDRLLEGPINRHVLSVMATCGMYNGSGSWMSTVGIPAKSGVAGAIMGVLPGQVGLAVFSPRLNQHGNSVRGVAVFERLSRDLELHMMHVVPTGRSALRSVEVRDGATVIELQGDIRFAGAEIFASRVCEGFSGDEVLIDLTRVRVIDNAARRLICEVRERLADDYTTTVKDPERLLDCNGEGSGLPHQPTAVAVSDSVI